MLPCSDFISLITLVSDKVNSSAVETRVVNGFQLLGIAPGAATSEVLTTPDNLRTMFAGVTESTSVKSPGTKSVPLCVPLPAGDPACEDFAVVPVTIIELLTKFTF